MDTVYISGISGIKVDFMADHPTDDATSIFTIAAHELSGVLQGGIGLSHQVGLQPLTSTPPANCKLGLHINQVYFKAALISPLVGLSVEIITPLEYYSKV